MMEEVACDYQERLDNYYYYHHYNCILLLLLLLSSMSANRNSPTYITMADAGCKEDCIGNAVYCDYH